jgi:hypothetical protein
MWSLVRCQPVGVTPLSYPRGHVLLEFGRVFALPRRHDFPNTAEPAEEVLLDVPNLDVES